MKLSVVIPARNEASCLGETLRALHTALRKEAIEHELVVVNDGSTDHSESLLAALSEEIPTLRVFHNRGKNGYGLAVRLGLQQSRGEAVAVFMADSSDSPGDLIRFFRAMESDDFDCVFGTRFAKESKVVDYPVFKLLLNRLVNKFIQILFHIPYNDVTNAFKLYRRTTLEGLKPFLSLHFNLTVELPLKAIVRGYRYTVLPNDWTQRKTGVSKLKIKEMGSRYLFIILYCFIEKWLARGDYLATPESIASLRAHTKNCLPKKDHKTGTRR
jgi:dolichol-phosphate mannosyltransferase